MKHYSQNARKRNRRKAGAPAKTQSLVTARNGATDAHTARPTPQQMAHGAYQMPTGPGKQDRPIYNAASDMIGALHHAGKITDGQEQAARHWQQLRRAYVAELPDVQGFKSCIAGNVPGYDDGDGDPAIIAEYRSMEARLSRSQRIEVLHVCEDGNRPRQVDLLRAALDVVSGS